MQSVRNILRKAVLVVTLSLVTIVGGEKPGRAQAIVNDPLSMASGIGQFVQSISNMMSQLGISEENLGWVEDIMDAVQGMMEVLDDIRILQNMYRSLEYQYKVYERYWDMLTHMEDYGFNPYMISNFRNQLKYSLKSVEQLINQAIKLLSDTGLSKAEKISFAEMFAKNVTRNADEAKESMDRQIDIAEAESAFLVANNLLDGIWCKTGVYEIGLPAGVPEVGEDYKEVDQSSMKIGEGMEAEDKGAIGGAMNVGYKVIYMIFGLLLAGSLLLITVKFMRGDPNSGAGFARIFVVLIAAALLIGVLSSVIPKF